MSKKKADQTNDEKEIKEETKKDEKYKNPYFKQNQ